MLCIIIMNIQRSLSLSKELRIVWASVCALIFFKFISFFSIKLFCLDFSFTNPWALYFDNVPELINEDGSPIQ